MKTQTHEERWPGEKRGRDCTGASTSQGMSWITDKYQKLKEARKDFPTGFRDA